MKGIIIEAHKYWKFSCRRPRLLSNHTSEGHALGCTGHCDGPAVASGATRELSNGVAPKIPMGHSEASQGSPLSRALCCVLEQLHVWEGSRALDVFLDWCNKFSREN